MRWFWVSITVYVLVVASLTGALISLAISDWGLAGTGPWRWGTVYENPFIAFAIVISLPSILLHSWSAVSGRLRALALVGLALAALPQAFLGTLVVTFRFAGDTSPVEREEVGVAVTATVWIVLIHIVLAQALALLMRTLSRRQ